MNIKQCDMMQGFLFDWLSILSKDERKKKRHHGLKWMKTDEERKERLRMKSTLKRIIQKSLFQFLLVSLMRGMDSSGLTAVPGTLAARSSRRKRAKTEARMERPPPKTMA